MSARHMRQDFYDFVPVCKLLFVGNHRPRLRQVDEAERRRFRIVPFVHKVPENRRDATLEDALRDEYPAILAWMLDGAKAVIAEGFRPLPAAVTQATDDYFAENDTFALWAGERLLLHKDYSVPGGESSLRTTGACVPGADDRPRRPRPVSPAGFQAANARTGRGPATKAATASGACIAASRWSICDDDEPLTRLTRLTLGFRLTRPTRARKRAKPVDRRH